MDYPGKAFGVPEDIASDYLNVLVIGSAVQTGQLHGPALKVRIMKLGAILHKLLKKHLSDSPGIEDKTRFCIELLETALAIAKGEFVP